MANDQLRWAWSCVRPYRGRVAALAMLSLAEIALRVATPWTLAVIIDHALGKSPLDGHAAVAFDALGLSPAPSGVLVAFVALGLGMQLAQQVVVMAHGRLSVAAGQLMIRDLRERLFAHVQALSLQHHAVTPTGDAVQRLETDARCIEQLVLRGLFPLAFSALTLAVMFTVLANVDRTLAVLALAIVPPLYVWVRWYGRRMATPADHARRTDSRLSSRLYEVISAIRLVKSHAREDHERARFRGIADAAAQAWISVGKQSGCFAIVNGALTVIGTSLVLFAGGRAVIDGRITVGTLLLVLAYIGFVYGPLSAIATTTGELQRAFASARRVRAALAVTPEVTDEPHGIPADSIRGEVRFEDVAFAYRPERPVLDGVTFEARPGEIIALVGPSGAGKSTLASLLVRFFDAGGGRITIDGVPIEHYALRSLRARIAIVLQEVPLISGPVCELIRYGKLGATDDELVCAARAAHAHEFIEQLPAGYDTWIGEGGAGLSGGQRQRLSIARAFLKDAPILVLDEPTSALDSISEHLVTDAIRRLWAGRTTFVIAHRLSTVQKADRILVLDGGRIVGSGTHDELRRTNPLYRQLSAELTEPTEPDAPLVSATR